MGSTKYIFANTGQLVRLVIQTLDIDGYRIDGYIPVVQNIIFPDFSVAVGYPRHMTQVYITGDGYVPGVDGDGYVSGLYIHGLLIPTGITALGTYVANVYWENNGQPQWDSFAINVARPFGNSSVSPI
jgi:hypothetical protein